MAIDPDELLIFKSRESPQDAKATSKKKPSVPENEPMLPKHKLERMLGRFSSRPPEPVVAANKEPRPQPVAAVGKTVQQQGPKPKQEPQQQPEKKAQQQKAAESTRETTNINLLKYRMFSESVSRRNIEPSKNPESATGEIGEVQKPGSPGNAISIYTEGRYKTKLASTNERLRISRDAAAGNRCASHPWRNAYAICGMCKRPFCYEDVTEFNNNYYCLSDIDAVDKAHPAEAGSSGGTSYMLSGVLLMLSFMTFFAFSYRQTIFVFRYLNRVGLPFFLIHANYSYIFSFADNLLLIAGLITAILIIVQSRKGLYAGTFVMLSSVAIFSYQYLSTGTQYFSYIGIMMFAAFALMLYSKAMFLSSDVNERYLSPTREIEASTIKWPNVGKF